MMVNSKLKIEHPYYRILCKINHIVEENAIIRGHCGLLNMCNFSI